MKKERTPLVKFEVLHELTMSVSSCDSVDALITVAIAEVSRAVAPDLIFFFLLENNELSLIRSWQHPEGESSIAHEVKEIGVCLCGLAAAEKNPVYSTNIHKDARCTLRECKMAGVQSFAAIPLRSAKGEVMGLISTGSFTKRDFSKDAQFIEILCSHVAIALENIFNIRELQRSQDSLANVAENERLARAKVDSTLSMLNAFLSATTDAVFIKDTEGRYLMANHATAAFVGKPAEEIIGKDDFHLFPSADADFLKKRDRCIMESDSVDTSEENLQIHGETRTFLATKGAVRDSDGKVIGLFGISRDITERKIAEKKIQQLNRVYALLSNVNQAIVRLRDRQQLFDEICRIAVEDGKFRMAWIGEVDENNKLVRVAASYGSTGDYLNNIRISINDIPEGQGPVGRAIRCGTHVVSSDIEHDEYMSLWRSNALRHGYRSLASFPITVSGRTIGALSFYASEAGFFSDQEVILLDKLAEDISYALQFIATERALRESEERLTAIFDNTSEGILLADPETKKFHYGNKMISQMLGYGFEEIKHLGIMDIHPEKDLPHVIKQFERQAKKEITLAENIPVKRKDGTIFFADINAKPLEFGGKAYLAGFFTDISERIIAQEALKEKEYLLTESQRIAHIGSWSWEIETGTIVWTDEAYRIYGCSQATFTLTPVSFLGMLHTDEQPLMQEWIRACLAGEQPGDLVFRTLLPDGTVRILNGRGNLEYDADNRPVRMVGTVQDITEQKKAEEALHESELRFKSILQTAGDAVIMADANDTIISWNNGAQKIFGYEENEVINRSLTMLMPERYRDRHIAGMNRVVSGGQSEYLGRIMDFHGIRKDGTEFPLELSVNALPSVRGTYFLGIIRDVTEQNLIKAALEEQKRFAEGIMENSAAATFVIGADHKVILWNKACEALTGVTAAEMIGTDNQWKPFYPHKRPTLCDVVVEGNILDLPSLYGKYSASPLIGGGLRSEGRYANLNGKERYIIFDAAPIFGSNDNLLYAIETLQDITELKKLEEQLQHAQKLEGIGQLAGGIAHDFNNILNAVIGFGSLAQMNIDSPSRLREYLGEVITAGQRGASLTHQLLAFSRKQTLDMKQINLNALINNLMKLLQRLIREDIILTIMPAANDLFIMADSSQIDQVIINLITNARDAIQYGGEITITAEPVLIDTGFTHMHGFGTAGQYVLISISDTGAGMDRQTIDRIFEPFFTTKELGKGTGLGLAVVYGIIKQHNGFIDVYSELGKGTTFKIYLPITAASVDRAKETEIIQSAGGTETILIADDDRALRGLLQALLEQFGYTVISAEDGADAVDKFRENRDSISLIILDAIMPNKNGQEAYEEISLSDPDIKTIILSGYTKDIFDHEKLADRKIPFLTKPILPNDLLNKIREVLNG